MRRAHIQNTRQFLQTLLSTSHTLNSMTDRHGSHAQKRRCVDACVRSELQHESVFVAPARHAVTGTFVAPRFERCVADERSASRAHKRRWESREGQAKRSNTIGSCVGDSHSTVSPSINFQGVPARAKQCPIPLNIRQWRLYTRRDKSMGPHGLCNTGMCGGDSQIGVHNCTLKGTEANTPRVSCIGDKSSVGTSTCRLNTEEGNGVVREAENGEFTPPKQERMHVHPFWKR